MASRKRWSELYAEGNPLAVPQAIRRHLKTCACGKENERLRYLWVVLDEAASGMTEEYWLNIIDEAASLGADTLVVTTKTGVSERRELELMCRWAADTYGMRVGLHLSDPELGPSDVRVLKGLNHDRFCVFVHSNHLPAIRDKVGEGVRLVHSDGLEDGAVQPHCELPQQMACVSESGSMYTCGLVVGQDGYFLGNANEARIQDVHCNDALPHAVPEGTSSAANRCEGCPPLLEERFQKAFES